MMIRKSFCFILMLILLIVPHVVNSLAISQPKPFDLRVLPGDTVGFTFQVQAVTSRTKQTCTLSTSGFDPLKVSLDKEKIVVDAGKVVNVYGTVSVPRDVPIGTYRGKITAKCLPSVELQEVSGSLITNKMTRDLSIHVVGHLEGMKTLIPEKEKPTTSYLLVFIIIIAVLVVGVYYWYQKKK